MTEDEMLQLSEIGEKIYNALLKNNKIKYIICPCSIGDTVNIVLYVNEYKKQCGYNDVVLIIRENHIGLIKMFPWINSIAFTDIQMMSLRLYIVCNEKYNEENVLYGHFKPKDLSMTSFEINQDIPFVYHFKDLLGIPLDAKPVPGEFSCIPNERKETIKAIYRDSVIIFPFAQTIQINSMSFWQKIVDRLSGKGIEKIFTNSFDNVIPDTNKCDLSIEELCYASGVAKKCIGVRSGIFDAIVASESISSSIVLYSKLIMSESSHCLLPESVHLYYDLRDINPFIDAVYLSYSSKKEDEIIQMIDNLTL